jgi:hypothetical protein
MKKFSSGDGKQFYEIRSNKWVRLVI